MWDISDHVCRHCMGRVLIRRSQIGVTARCADCGAEATGSVEALCACGVTLTSGANVGLRCRRAARDEAVAGCSEIEVVMR